MNMHRFAPFAAFTLVATLVTGCGKDGAGGDEGTRTSIASLMGQDQWSEDQYRDQEAQIQELVATCMIEQGWEYIPVESPDAMFEYNPEDELERLQREGFQISYWTLNQGNDEVVGNDPWAEWVDPNRAILEAMDEDEALAYEESLYGTQEEQEAAATIEVDPETGDEMWTMTGWAPGCYGEAQEAVYGAQPSQGEDYWDAVNVFYEELQVRVEADPRMKALNETWVACMREAGYDYESPNDIWESVYTEFQARHDEILGPDFYFDPFEGWTLDQIDDFYATATPEERDALWDVPQSQLTDDQRTSLEALLAEEIELAVAEFTCSQPMYEQSGDLYAQIEEEYALEHRAELEALAASLGADS